MATQPKEGEARLPIDNEQPAQEDQSKAKKSKKKFNPVKEMPKLNPEPDYIIKTRPPMWGNFNPVSHQVSR